ncbi:MAG: hypothetical protein LKF41_04725 [Bifidobacterium sp.]|jgi:hypothetical protein|nr:hypothetical protein [Bifidobacterium sp.]MCH4175146.1 hypothetical protein [Bifidobacterium sp.]
MSKYSNHSGAGVLIRNIVVGIVIFLVCGTVWSLIVHQNWPSLDDYISQDVAAIITIGALHFLGFTRNN